MTIFLDSNVVIYAVEGHSVFGAPAMARIATAQASGDDFLISDLVQMECLVRPIRNRTGPVEAAFRAFFARPDVRSVSLTTSVVDRATRIRATRRFKTIDALQLAAAVEHGANVFLTNDTRLSGFTGIRIEVL